MSCKASITSYLRGNLGNQLFVYATVRQMQEKYFADQPCRLIFDNEKYIISNRLQNFKLVGNLCFCPVRLPLVKRKIKYYMFDRTRCSGIQYKHPQEFFEFTQKRQPILNKYGFFLCEDGYIPLPEKMPCHIIADGFFQSEKYFSKIRPKLLAELTPSEPLLPQNFEIVRRIEESESICLTVRMGDYIGNKVHDVCTADYFKRAISIAKQKCENGQVFLFSDDVKAAKEMLGLGEDTVLEEGNNPDYEKLRIMSKCKHFILSNSSFSWWVQYLSHNRNKMVIAPDHWYNAPIPCDIYQNEWIVLSV